MYLDPTQSTPGGFLFVFFGGLLLVAAGLSGYAGYLVYDNEVTQGIQTEYGYLQLFGITGVLIVAALALIWWGLKLALAVGPYDIRDPKEPALKF